MKFDLKDYLTPEDTKGKYIFWDLDGTLAPYRFNGHISANDGTQNGASIEETNNGIFLERLPSKHMKHVVSSCGSKENFIISHVLSQKEIDDKTAWLDKHFPTFKKKLFVLDYGPKYERILDYCKENKIDLKDVIFVDDVISYLIDAELNGICSYHISSFLDWDYFD